MDNRRKARANTCLFISICCFTQNRKWMLLHVPCDILSYPVERRVVTYAACNGYEGLGSYFGEDAFDSAAMTKVSSRSANCPCLDSRR